MSLSYCQSSHEQELGGFQRNVSTGFVEIIMFVAYISLSYCQSSNEEESGALKGIILRKIYGPFCDRGEWRIRWNEQLHDIYDDINVVKRIKIQRLRWLGYVLRKDSSNPVRKVFES